MRHRCRFLLPFLWIALGFWSVEARTQASLSFSSPSDVLTISVGLDVERRAYYTVSRSGVTLIGPSRLGFLFTNAQRFERNLALTSLDERLHDSTWEQPWGERRFIRDRYREKRIRLDETSGPKRTIDVVFRVYDDGFGFRYEFPKSGAPVHVAEELTEFNIEPPSTAWWIPAGEWNRYEYLYQHTPLSEVGQAHTPLTIRTDTGVHMAVHEAALIDYSATWLRRVDGQRLKTALAPSASGPKVVRTPPFNTPWRSVQIADSAAALAMSNLILNLNEPNVLGDVSWVVPHKYIGIWWGMHLGTHTWSSGPQHGATTRNAMRYIDFAAKHGFRGVLIEGWNIGWDGDWFWNGDVFSFTKPYPDFDLERVAAYAKRKGVRLIGHHETSGNITNYEAQLEAALELYARLGVDSLKTGYVADAGGIKTVDREGTIRYEWHDGQVMSRHHLEVVQEAARRKISINPHEPIKDTGLRRTYPNWVSREGARGMEYNAWGIPPNPPEHEPTLVFTRLLAGPMDFTPGILSLKGKDGTPIQSTIAKQLALYVVLYSPIQMAADLPEHYERYLKPFQFIKDVPTDWSDTIVLNGEVGDFVTIARKDRNSEDWFLGSVTDEQARELDIELSFLDPERKYRAQIYRDGDDANWRERPHSIAIETRTMQSNERLRLHLAEGGGQAIRFIPQ